MVKSGRGLSLLLLCVVALGVQGKYHRYHQQSEDLGLDQTESQDSEDQSQDENQDQQSEDQDDQKMDIDRIIQMARVIPTKPRHCQSCKTCTFGGVVYPHGSVMFNYPYGCLQIYCDKGENVMYFHGGPGKKYCCEFRGQMYSNWERLTSHCISIQCHYSYWYMYDTIDHCCGHCKIHDDPHVVTYDSYHYDFQGHCNYTVTQTGFGHHPDHGVFSDFEPFQYNNLASSVSSTTFRDSAHTIVTLNADSPSLVFYNSQPIVIKTATFFKMLPPNPWVNHYVMVLRHPSAADCNLVVGSSQLVVQQCANRLDVWAHPAHHDDLYGLCGHFNQYTPDDFTARDNTVYQLQKFPRAFPVSWLAHKQSDRKCTQSCPEPHLGCVNDYTTDPCYATTAAKNKYYSLCSTSLSSIIGQNSAYEYLKQDCAMDLCLMNQNNNSKNFYAWMQKLKVNAEMVKYLHEITYKAGGGQRRSFNDFPVDFLDAVAQLKAKDAAAPHLRG
ncbi:Mucin-2-like 2 [Homarus americanus]|uniref:Mucin-2-like 2 n=1 Tax=Homarus americanus TaxID=6706 RepID=A0A8J5JV31_HOMAM|nr:Mucin-2-like 2 [Homarus americanus]